MYGGLDNVDGIVNGFVVRLDHAIHIDGAVQMFRIVDAGESAQLFDKRGALFLCDKMRGLHRVHQQFEFRQLKHPRADKVAVLNTFHTYDIPAHVNEELDIAVDALATSLDAFLLPILQDVRCGYIMVFVRLLAQ